jgi:hypothetical protein
MNYLLLLNSSERMHRDFGNKSNNIFKIDFLKIKSLAFFNKIVVF